MSGDDEIRIILERLAQLTGHPPPPGITPDALATGTVSMSQLLRALGLSANSGDPSDMTDAQTGYAERSAKTGDAMAKFPANEAESAGKMSGVGSPAEMAQQIPQMISGVAGGISGAMQGFLQPLSQLPQQAAQIGQQMMQAGMGAMQHGAEGALGAGEAIPGELTGSTSGAGAGGGGVGGLGATTPTSGLSPLPAPSAGTEPASSRTTSTPPPSASAPTGASRGGIGAMPMMPPGAMHGAGAGAKDEKPDTKRIVPPTVRNGAPVQGRITTPPPAPEVVKRVEGKPVASRRIILPDQKRDDDDKNGNS
ncbi:hypothetical protein [Mycobacterium montefiorense]|uniref:Uncharacterized protein n=1 Tax=Mycobacterium montefiorense TaxID=154654 RepID=A0AA37UPP2_9MYCO|nr:hypothetical protein [Mycobacterium montefiorense]GBG39297.1 hypothetical protein MmonteBS_36690 [Mycobacterium montefiorense]GKU37677.1 hypothetical protein NJB14191_50230 [Mycobacterium montefiorense]GKU41882.1 hypothetical protein NJB14192_38650 [Mycobacterium montefiorense]GKU45661.1 hypothetical protein NJB14194_22820 [Mycobacterium montefiorense]GKU53382.1 hypothetical protein NJB14195_46230 [Mycobacterium montefiorense]